MRARHARTCREIEKREKNTNNHRTAAVAELIRRQRAPAVVFRRCIETKSATIENLK